MMKDFKRLALMFALLLNLCMMSACTDESLAAWPAEEPAPNQLVHAGDWWYAAIGNYGSPNASLAVGKSPETMELVYESKGDIWGELTAAADYGQWLSQRLAHGPRRRARQLHGKLCCLLGAALHLPLEEQRLSHDSVALRHGWHPPGAIRSRPAGRGQ